MEKDLDDISHGECIYQHTKPNLGWMTTIDMKSKVNVTQTYTMPDDVEYIVDYEMNNPDEHTVTIKSGSTSLLMEDKRLIVRSGNVGGEKKTQVHIVSKDYKLSDYMEDWSLETIDSNDKTTTPKKRKHDSDSSKQAPSETKKGPGRPRKE